MFTIQPVVAAGGSGTRLWPLSTSQIPKQFITLNNKGSFIEETIRRVLLVLEECKTKKYNVSDPILVMNESHDLPKELSHHDNNVIYEPYANDTGVAVARACLEIQRRHIDSSNVIIVMLPADHYIYNVDAFVANIVSGINNVTDDNIVLYGIDPTAPETKYGYIIPGPNGIKFKEKPNLATAISLLNDGALWNSGIFAAKINTILSAFEKTSIFDWINNPRPGKAASFDVAVLQEHKNIHAVHCTGWGWSDVGTWNSFTEIPEVREEIENTQNAIIKNCNNVEILNRGSGRIVIIGCSNLRIVSVNNNTLITPTMGEYDSELKDIASSLA